MTTKETYMDNLVKGPKSLCKSTNFGDIDAALQNLKHNQTYSIADIVFTIRQINNFQQSTLNGITPSAPYDNSNLNYQVYDLQGKVIENKKVTANNTTISMEALPKAIYFLNVTKNNRIVKTFKIIKN